MLLNPANETFAHLDPASAGMMRETIRFFEAKGKTRLKHDDHERVWYEDFLAFVKEKQLFARLLTPAALGGGDPAVRWDTARNCACNEILAFFGLSYWYAWQVSILGLGPIWMSPNQALKEKAARLLRAGGIFAFGLSEKGHGADLYASEMLLTPLGKGRYVADGGKYYIGNANRASLVSVFGKNSENGEYVFFAVESGHRNFDLVKNVINSQMYVAEFTLQGYPLGDDDLLSNGQDAWDAALNTVNVGKFNLGWASIGICTHALYEALGHAAHRRLYGQAVTDFPHVRRLLSEAWTRLVAMRLFATRASDYLRSASLQDRRYLLYNPLVKMKVTMEGEAVINRLWDVIAARGFEKDTYFEMAARDIRALPKLEGTVHVNMALVVKFMANYLFNPGSFPEIPRRVDPADDTFLFNQGPTRGLGQIRFHDWTAAYGLFDTPNLQRFRGQIDAFKALLLQAPPDKAQAREIDFLLTAGELFTLVVYGQLILEQAQLDRLPAAVVDSIFQELVQDFSRHALELSAKSSATAIQSELCLRMIGRPFADPAVREEIWRQRVFPLVDSYAMKP